MRTMHLRLSQEKDHRKEEERVALEKEAEEQMKIDEEKARQKAEYKVQLETLESEFKASMNKLDKSMQETEESKKAATTNFEERRDQLLKLIND